MTTAIDLVTSTAGLASNPRAIDGTLDKVRAITARLKPGDALSATDEAGLFAAYLDIEQYLMTNDPIRTFSKQELRARINPDLLAKLNTYEKQ